MSVYVTYKNSTLTLIFDGRSTHLSALEFRSLQQKLSTIDGVISIGSGRSWCGNRKLSFEHQSKIKPTAILRKLAIELRILDERSDRTRPVICSPGESSLSPPRLVTQNSVRVEVSRTGQMHLERQATADTSFRRFVLIKLRELAYGILAVGSFGMSWVGLLVPGIPTVPFVILTAHFSLKASPALRRRLLRSKMFGQMISDWQSFGAIRQSTRRLAYTFTIIIIVVSFLLAPQSPVLYFTMVFMAGLGLLLISRIPVLPATPNDHAAFTDRPMYGLMPETP